MQIRLLGPVDVVVGGQPRPVHGLRRKAVLAVLALHGGVVSTDQLTDAVWGDAAPPTAMNSLQTHVSYLRGVLGARTAILTRPPGYVLQLPGDGTDVRVAERLLEQGTRSADPVVAVRCLREALGLWRGRPLADVADLAWLSAQEERLGPLRMRIRQALSEARLAAGEHARLVPELEQMVADHPLDEPGSGWPAEPAATTPSVPSPALCCTCSPTPSQAAEGRRLAKCHGRPGLRHRSTVSVRHPEVPAAAPWTASACLGGA